MRAATATLGLLALHSAILGLLLSFRRRPAPGDRALGAFLLALGAFLAFCAVDTVPELDAIPAFDVGYLVFLSSLPPLFYLWARTRLGLPLGRPLALAFHAALPGIAAVLGLASLPWLLAPVSPALASSPPLVLRAIQGFADLEPYRAQVLAYLILSWRVLRSSPRSRGRERAILGAATLLFAAAWAADQAAALALLLGPEGQAPAREAAGTWVVAALACLVLGLGYLALVDGWSSRDAGRRPRASDAAERSRLKEVFAEVSAAMDSERPWRDPGFGLAGFARSIGRPPRQVSQAINEALGIGFKSYVNGLRVAEARRLLSVESSRGILDVALEAGFNSKSAFNRVFKETCGYTPSEERSRGPA